MVRYRMRYLLQRMGCVEFKGEGWTLNQRLIRGPGSILTQHFVTGFFIFT